MAKISWLAPHPDMQMAPAPSGDGMLKIIREDGGFTTYRQTNAGMTEVVRHHSLAEAKAFAEGL
jgi:hypothetical protein